MKMISRGTCGAVLGLCLLSVMVRGAGADDHWAQQQAQAQREREECQRQQEQAQRDRDQAERDRQARDDWYAQQAQAQRDREQADRDRQAQDDWYKQQAQAQAERDEWYRQQAQAQRDREQADRDRQAQDDWYKQQAQAQAERDEWYRQQAQAQREREQADYWQAQKDREYWQAQRDSHQSLMDGIERAKQQTDEILNKAYDDHPWARAGWTAGAEWKAGGWVLPESAAPAGRSRFRVPPQPLVILNPFVSQAKERQNEEQVSQQVTQFYPQMILNRFVSPAR